MDISSILNIFFDFANQYVIGLHFAVNYGSIHLEFYPFVYIAVVIITELVFDLFFPRPKGDE